MNYLAVDANGAILWAERNTPAGVSPPTIAGTTVVSCTDADAAIAFGAVGGSSAYWDGTKVVAAPASPGNSYVWDWPSKSWKFDLPTGQALKNSQINAAAQAALQGVVNAYPDLEVATWPQQYAEAQAYTANSAAATPMLSAISAASGQTVAALAANVMAKASSFQNAAGAVVGRRIARQTAVSAATTQAQLDAITW